MGLGDATERAHGINQGELLSACRVLFGPDVKIDQDFLCYLQPEGAKSAYRKRARESHPDAHPWAEAERTQLLAHEFMSVSNAYQQLSTFLMQRPAKQCSLSSHRATHQTQKQHPCRPNSQSAAGSSQEPLFYTGPVPFIELKIGRYLYFRGLVSFQAVVQALIWQREQRPSVGSLARSRGWLDERQVHQILQSSKVHGRFGVRAVQLGLLKPWQRQELLDQQLACQERLGRYFIQHHNMHAYDLALIEQERQRHNALVGGR